MNMSTTIATFDTSNFYLAAYLLSNGIVFVDIERLQSGKSSFVFRDDKRLNGFVDQFMYGEPQADVRKFISAIRQLKSGIYDGL